MKCPKCAREIDDSSLFCGYCGAKIEKVNGTAPQPPRETAPPPGPHGKQRAVSRDPPSRPGPEPRPYGKARKKNRLGLKILLVCSVLAVLAGGILGWMTARGILDLREYLPMDHFSWTDPSEGVAAADERPGMEANSQEKDESSAMSEDASRADAPSESVSAGSDEAQQQLPAPSDSAGTSEAAAGSGASVP